MSKFTSGDLINNINKNYPLLCGNSIIGYLNAYEMEQSIINIDLDFDKLNDTELTFIENIAATSQYLKKYFLTELVRNFLNMEFLSLYVESLSPIISEVQIPQEVPTIEEINQSGGFSSYILIYTYISLFFYNILTNATEVGNSLSMPNQGVGVSINTNTNTNYKMTKMPRAISQVTEELNPLNETQMQMFAKEFGTNINFPEAKIIKSDNLKDIYGPDYIKKIELTQTMFEWLTSSKEKKQDEFNNFMLEKTKYINELTKLTHVSLENMCNSFVSSSDVKLPIPIYELLNRELQPKYEELKHKSKQFLENREIQLIEEKKKEKGVIEARPGMIDASISDIKNTLSSSVSSIKHLFKYVSTTGDSSYLEQKRSSSEIEKLYQEIDKEVHNELTSLETEQIPESLAFKELSEEAMKKLAYENVEMLEASNLKVYLSSVCKISFGKIPKYVFNVTSGQLYIKDNKQSRYHIMILAKNVVSYYNTILKGIYEKDDFGNINIVVPDENRKRNLLSLYEKANAIIPLLTEYDIGIMQSLTDDHEAASDLDNFYSNIHGMWLNIKNNSIEASAQFPITTKTKKLEMVRKIEEESLNLEIIRKEHELEINNDLDEIKRNRDITDITKQQWDIFNEYFGINIASTLKTGTIVIDSLVNSTSDMGVNVFEGVGRVGSSMTNSFLGTAWGILFLSCILSIPVLGFLSIKTGLVSAIFKRITRFIDVPIQQVASVVPNPIEVPNDAINDVPLVLRFTKKDGKWILKKTAGGKRYNRKMTRRHKRKVTRKQKNKKLLKSKRMSYRKKYSRRHKI